MGITINNKEVEFVANETVSNLLKRLKFTFPLVIVKIDGTHIPRSDYTTTKVLDKSDIKIIHMISGG